MKRICVLTLLILISISACQPTPYAPIVQSKNDGKLEQAISAAPAEEKKYETPSEWQESIDGYNGTNIEISVDAKITCPDVTRYPVYRVMLGDIPQERANEIIQYFIGDDKLYDTAEITTKDSLLIEIQEMMYQLDDPSSQLNTDTKDNMSEEEYAEYRKEYEKRLQDLQKQYAQAPSVADRKTVSRVYNVYDKEGITYREIHGITDKNVDIEFMQVGNCIKHYRISDLSKGGVQYVTALFSKTEGLNFCDITFEQAKKEADKVLDDLGYTDWELSMAGATVANDESKYEIGMKESERAQMYMFYYTQNIDGIPFLYYSGQAATVLAAKQADALYWPQPYVWVAVYNDGVCTFSQYSAITIGDCLNSNVELLPFEKIQDIFRKYIVMQADFADTVIDEKDVVTARQIDITDIRMGYIKLPEKNDIENGIIVPVWMFYGTEHLKYLDQEHSSWQLDESGRHESDNTLGHAFLCINAIDGSVVDLSLGY